MDLIIIYILAVLFYILLVQNLRAKWHRFCKYYGYSCGFILWILLYQFARDVISINNVFWVSLRLLAPIFLAVITQKIVIDKLYHKAIDNCKKQALDNS